MTTYNDHPLAFLTSRVSAKGLRGRAETWRMRKLSVEGFDVPEGLERAADLVDAITSGIEKVANLIEAGEDIAVVQRAILEVPTVDASIADGIWELGQALRNGFKDPHGGSTASHLEMAADELRHLSKEVLRLRAVSHNDPNDIRIVALGAIGRELVEPTHDAPVFRM